MTVAGDMAVFVPSLRERIDLALSFQVLEHVKPLKSAVANVHQYLRPRGRFIAYFSGSFSLFALVNRVLPRRLGIAAMRTLLNRRADTVFPAYYDKCWQNALERMFKGWRAIEIVPMYQGEGYFSFSRPIHRLYCAYEKWSSRHPNLASHYLIEAVK